MAVLQSHRPERLGCNFIHPVRVTSATCLQVKMKRPAVPLPADRYGGCLSVDVPQFVGELVQRQGSQVGTVGVDLIETVFSQEDNCFVDNHPRLRVDDPYRVGNLLK